MDATQLLQILQQLLPMVDYDEIDLRIAFEEGYYIFNSLAALE